MPVSLEKSIIVTLFIVGCCSTTLLTIDQVMAQGSEINIKNNDGEKNKLEVISNINLQNISKTGLLKVVGVINGEDFVKNIPLDKLKESTKKLKVTFSMNKDNEINSAHKPDEFFVCAYHVENPVNIKLQNRPNVGLKCLQIEYSKLVVKVTFNAHFQQAENE